MTPLELLNLSLKEDIGRGDLFSKVASSKEVKAKVISKSDGVLAGVKYINEFKNIDASIKIEFLLNDGDNFKKGDTICKIKGDSNKILSYERVILNLLQHSSGIATNTNNFVKLLDGYDFSLNLF